MNNNGLRNFLTLSYDELEQLNLKAKEQRKNRVAPTRSGKNGSNTLLMKSGSRRSPFFSAISKAACTCSIMTRSS